MGFDLVRAIDESPLLNLLKECGKSAVGFVAQGVAGAVEGAGQIAANAAGTAFASVKETLMGASMTRSGPELAQARTIEAPAVTAPSRDPHHVDMADLCSFSAPTFGSFSNSVGTRSV